MENGTHDPALQNEAVTQKVKLHTQSLDMRRNFNTLHLIVCIECAAEKAFLITTSMCFREIKT